MTAHNRPESVRTYCSHKIGWIGKKALQTEVGKKIFDSLYKSSVYSFLSSQISDFKNYKLIQEIKNQPMPKHLAVIMDGNRRFATEVGLSPTQGHYYGLDKLEILLDWCLEIGIKILTVYAFSTENFTRKSEEVKILMDLCDLQIKRAQKDERIHKKKVRVKLLGDIKVLPKELQQSVKQLEADTKDYKDYQFNIAFAYGGREEIVQAIKHIVDDVKNNDLSPDQITEKTVSNYLYTTGLPDPDLILRTSGEARISNFLLWQLAYSELYFTDVYWPAFQRTDFLKAIKDFQRRKRRYGK